MTFPNHKGTRIRRNEKKIVITTPKSMFRFQQRYTDTLFAQIRFNKWPMQINYIWTLTDEKKWGRISPLEQHKIHRIKTRDDKKTEWTPLYKKNVGKKSSRIAWGSRQNHAEELQLLISENETWKTAHTWGLRAFSWRPSCEILLTKEERLEICVHLCTHYFVCRLQYQGGYP